MRVQIACVLLAAGCQLSEVESDGGEEATSETASALLYTVSGQQLEVTTVASLHFQTSRIASCGNGVLYATRTDNTLWFNMDSGVGTWTQVTAGSMGTRIACDRRHLFSLDSAGTLYHATTTSHGQLARDQATSQVWYSAGLAAPAGTTEIQSGMGNIYALVVNPTTHVSTLYASELASPTSAANYVQGAASSWVMLANNLGSDRATGAGSKAMYTATSTSLPYRKMNRAFGANPDDTLYFNDTMLDGQNWWTQFPNGGENLGSITADDSNTLFAVAAGQLFSKKLVRYEFRESNCTDGLDNDANGQIDAEDPVCRDKLAGPWCQTHTGSYCIDRIQSTNGYSHALVTCSGGAATIEPGACMKTFAGNADFITERQNDEPVNTGHYCSVIDSDGTWDFDYTGNDPCQELMTEHPTAQIVRSGLYSTSGINDVYVRCTNGWYVPAAGQYGTAPLAEAFNAVGHTANRCVFNVSPRSMPVFNAPFPTSVWAAPGAGGRGYKIGHVFDHITQCVAGDPGCPCATVDCPLALAQFGNNEAGSTDWLDNRGKKVTSYQKNQLAYDYIINEGVPLRSLGWGRVIKARYRDVAIQSSGDDCANGAICGTPYQGEIYVQYDVGTVAEYRESFVAYWGHTMTNVVVDGQTVRPGQLLGYSGMIGSSSGPHVHFGLTRLTNTNGHSQALGEQFGRQVPFYTTTGGAGVNWESLAGTVDPYGWRAPTENDPAAFRWGNAASIYGNVTGFGAWSPAVWPLNETPPYPAP